MTSVQAGGLLSSDFDVPCPTDVSVVSPRMGQHGWTFADIDSFPGADADPINGAEHVKDLYFKAEPNYEGRCGFTSYNIPLYAGC